MAYEDRKRLRQRDRQKRNGSASNLGTWLFLALGIGLIMLGTGKFPNPADAGGIAHDFLDIGSLETIRVASGPGSVSFESADVDGVRVLLGKGIDRNQLEVVQDGTGLDLAIQGQVRQLPAGDGTEPDLTVQLPPGLAPSLEISSSSGQVLLEGLELSGVIVRSGSGRICLDDSKIDGDVSLLASSGAVCLHHLDVSGGLQVVATVGDAELNGVSAGSYDFVAGSGRFDAVGLAGTRLNARASAGRMNLSAVTLLEEWNLQASAGALTVGFDEVPKDFTFAYEGSSGSLQVAERYGFQPPDVWPLSFTVGSGAGPRLNVRGSSGSFSLH